MCTTSFVHGANSSHGRALAKEHSLGSRLHKKVVARDNAIRRESASKFTRSRGARGGHALSQLGRCELACTFPARFTVLVDSQGHGHPHGLVPPRLGGHPMGIASPINGHVLLLLLLPRLAARFGRSDSTADATSFPASGVSRLYLTCVYTRASVRKPPVLEIQRRKRFHGCGLCVSRRHSHDPAERVAHRVVVVVIVVTQTSRSLRVCTTLCYYVCVPDTVIALEITRRALRESVSRDESCENRSLLLDATGNTKPDRRDTEGGRMKRTNRLSRDSFGNRHNELERNKFLCTRTISKRAAKM